MMSSTPTQPQTGPMQSHTLDEFGMGATLPDADYSLEELNDVDFGQYLTDFDAGDNLFEGLSADLLPQYDQVTPIAPVDTIVGDGSLPAAATSDKDSRGQESSPPTTALVPEDPITSAVGCLIDNAASNTMATEADCAITPDESLSAYQSPIFENVPFLPPPLPITWNTTPNLQPRLNSFRPVSAPPGGTYDPYNPFPPVQQYDQSLDLPGYDYPSPPSKMDSYSDSCFGFHAPGSHSRSAIDMSPMGSHPYQQASISYSGSPTQPIDPALMMNDFFGPPHMPRQVRQYLPPPTSSPYGAAAVFHNGHSSNNAKAKMQRPPTSNPCKRAALAPDDEERHNPKRQRIQNWVGDTNTAQGLHRSLQRFDLSLQAPGTAATPAPPSPIIDSSSLSLNDIPSGIDITKAVTLPIRRTRNPGRKQTIKQTDSVMKRNRVRRERYRASLPPPKRELYDFNASMAKGLISVAGGDEDEDAEFDDVAGGDGEGDVDMRDRGTGGVLIQ